MGTRPLGVTYQFKLSSAISFGGGKFLDEQFVYPANHQFIVGSSKDDIDGVIYKGTQNSGGDIVESDAFTDLSTSSFYYVKTTGGSGYTINYDS